MKREFTATSFIFHEKQLLLLFHRKFQRWLPPGGHVEPNELPCEAAIREAFEETGLTIQLLGEGLCLPPYSRVRPYLILLYPIPPFEEEPAHEHMDFAYLAKPSCPTSLLTPKEGHLLKWFSQQEILDASAEQLFPETRTLALHLFEKLATKLQ